MNLRSTDLAILKEIRSNTRDKRIFVRCSAIIAHEAGLSHEAISISLDIGLRSVHRYLQIYEHKGLEGLVQFKYSGRECELCEEQIGILKSELDKNLYASTEQTCLPLPTGRQVQLFIKDEWAI